MKRKVGLESGIFNMFSRMKGEGIIIYRQDCSSGWDRETGKLIQSNKIEIAGCAIVKPITRTIIQDSGGERGTAGLVLQTPPHIPIYTTDERDAAGADIIYIRDSFWKVMKVTNECYYWEAELELLPDNICKNLGILEY